MSQPSSPSTHDALTRLDRYIRARYPIVALLSHEETRVLSAVNTVAQLRGRQVYTWTVTHGLTASAVPGATTPGIPQIEGAQDPVAALETLARYQAEAPTIFVFSDLHRGSVLLHRVDEINIKINPKEIAPSVAATWYLSPTCASFELCVLLRIPR